MTADLAIPELSAAVERPIGEATGLANRAYTSPEFFRLERDRLFAPSWACLGHAADVPRAGDLRPVRLLGVPLLMARAAGGAVRVFHNVCSHRGNELVWEPCRVKGAIRCPYHAWTYDLEGRLTGTPNIGGFGVHEAEGFDRAAHGLRAVRSAVWLDLVFVNLTGDAEPFEAWIRPLAQRFERLGGAGYERRLHPATTHGEFRFDVRANWKLAVENNLDAAHLPWIHPSLNRQSPLEDHYCFLDHPRFAGQGFVGVRHGPPREPSASADRGVAGPHGGVSEPVPQRVRVRPRGPFLDPGAGAGGSGSNHRTLAVLLRRRRRRGCGLRIGPLRHPGAVGVDPGRGRDGGGRNAARPEVAGIRRRGVRAGAGPAGPPFPSLGGTAPRRAGDGPRLGLVPLHSDFDRRGRLRLSPHPALVHHRGVPDIHHRAPRRSITPCSGASSAAASRRVASTLSSSDGPSR